VEAGELGGYVEKISIHAPIQGAILDIDFGDMVIWISIHAPIQGAITSVYGLV